MEQQEDDTLSAASKVVKVNDGKFWPSQTLVKKNNKDKIADELITNFSIQAIGSILRINNQKSSMFQLRGKPDAYNGKNDRFHSPVFEDYFKRLGPADRLYVKREIREGQIFDEEGVMLMIPHNDIFDAYQLKYEKIPWRNLDYSENIFRMCEIIESSDNYDSYVLILILLSVYEEKASLDIRKKIDNIMNSNWRYRNLRLVDFKDRLFNLRQVVERDLVIHLQDILDLNKEITGINAIIDAMAEKNLIDMSNAMEKKFKTPDRRETSRINVVYSPKNLFDAWSIENLISKFKKSHKYFENLSIKSHVQKFFQDSSPTRGEKYELKIETELEMEVNSDFYPMEEVQKKKNKGGPAFLAGEPDSESDEEDEEAVTRKHTIIELVTISLRFENCVTGELKTPKLLATVIGKHIARHAVEIEIDYVRHNDVVECLDKIFEDSPYDVLAVYEEFLDHVKRGAEEFTIIYNDEELTIKGFRTNKELSVTYGKVKKTVDGKNSVARRSMHVCSYGKNMINIEELNWFNDRETNSELDYYAAREITPGLYPHQTEFVEFVINSMGKKNPLTVVVEASVGGGKTSSTLSLIKACTQITQKPYIIYASTDSSSCTEMIIRCINMGFETAGIFPTPSTYLGDSQKCISYKSSKNPKEFSSIDKIENCDVLVSDVKTLLFFLIKELELMKDTKEKEVKLRERPFIIVVDEITPGQINSPSEHALGTLLALCTTKTLNLVLMSASIDVLGPIRFLMSLSRGVKIITDSIILVPADLRNLEGNPIDPYLGHNDKERNDIVNGSAFFRRLISKVNVGKIAEKDRRYVRKTMEYEIFDPFVVYSQYEKLDALDYNGYTYKETDFDRIFNLHRKYIVERQKAPAILRKQILDVVRLNYPGSDVPKVFEKLEDSFEQNFCLEKPSIDSKFFLLQAEMPKGSSPKGFPEVYRTYQMYSNFTNYLLMNASDQVKNISTITQILDEEHLIKSIGKYALVQTTEPDLRLRIYGSLVNEIREILLNFDKDKVRMTRDVEEVKSEKNYKNVSKVNQAMKYAQEMFDDIANGLYSPKKETYLERLQNYLNWRQLGIPDERGNVTQNKIRVGVGSLIAAYRDYFDKNATNPETNREASEIFLSLKDLIEELIRKRGFNHEIPFRLDVKWLKEFTTETPLSDIYDRLLVEYHDEKEEVPNYKLNRLFGDKQLSRGLNRPIEAVIFTRSFEKHRSADDILQGSGRCGRPSLTKISEVYMSQNCYQKTLVGDKSIEILNTMIRYKFYLQPENANLSEPISKKNTRLETLAENIRLANKVI